MIKINDLVELHKEGKGITRTEANKLIGRDTEHGKVIGVHNRPKNKNYGLWLAVSRPMSLTEHFLVGNDDDDKAKE